MKTDDVVQGFTSVMQGRVDPQRIADGIRLIESAAVNYPAVGRVRGATFYFELQLDLTSGASQAFKGIGGALWVLDEAEISGNVYTNDSSALFDETDSFLLMKDNSVIYFFDKSVKLLGQFSGTSFSKLRFQGPAAGSGRWVAV
jgi:hypothetical protein